MIDRVYTKRPRGALLLWCLGMAAMLVVIGIGLTMAPAPASALLTGLAVNAALLAAAVGIGAWVASRCDLTLLSCTQK